MIKQIKEDKDLKDCAFTETEFHRLVDRIKDVSAIDFANETEVAKIKLGENVPFLTYDRLSEFRHFGSYEGAYYGQEFRNTIAGKIDAQSLNLRSFHYLLEYRKDGKIVIGSQYNGNYGDYDGLRKCFDYLLRG